MEFEGYFVKFYFQPYSMCGSYGNIIITETAKYHFIKYNLPQVFVLCVLNPKIHG